MSKTNGKDEEKTTEQAEGQPRQMPVLGLIVIDPENGQLAMQINDQIVQDRMQFFLAVGQLGLGNAMNEHGKAQASKIAVPERKILRPPGL